MSITMETLELNKEFNRLASNEQINERYQPRGKPRTLSSAASGGVLNPKGNKTVQALEANGIHAIVFESGEEARAYVMSKIPAGAQVYNPPSRTVDQIGLTVDIESSADFYPLRSRLHSLDRTTQQREIRKLISSPDVVVGSVHAVTEKGEVLIASATGSQLSSVVSGADKVVWVAGTQKLVSTLGEGFRRIREYSYPLENMRTHQVYGQPSAIRKILVVNGELPGRITMILVKQNLGF